MFATLAKRTDKVFRVLEQITEEAASQMKATDDLEARKAILAEWEKRLGGNVRNEYQAIKNALSHTPSDEALRKKLLPITKQMVLARSLLEGLSRGEGPAPHNAGGQFPPPDNVDPADKRKAEEMLQRAVAAMEMERRRHVPGELRLDFSTRCGRPLKEALARIESFLKDTGAEYERFLHDLRRKAVDISNEVDRERGDTADDLLYREVHRELRESLSRRLRSLDSEAVHCGIDRAAEDDLAWARARVREARARLEAASIKAELESYLVSFERNLKARVGDLKGWWSKPPVFQKVTLDDLDSRAQSGSFDGRDGVYLEFYSNGHLKSAVSIRDGSPWGALKVDQATPHARYEDGGNVAEFHPNGTIEEYGGRYEHELKARITFHDWVVQRVEEMLD